MTNYLEQFNQALMERSNKLNDTIEAINEKNMELKETSKNYAKAVLSDNTNNANTMYTQIKRLEIEIEQLEGRKHILENTEMQDNQALSELAEKLRQAHVEEMKKQSNLKRELLANIGVVEQECRDKIREIGTKSNECESKIINLANEILQVVNYINYDDNIKRRIKKFGLDSIITTERISL